jgi:hypothetical protein
MADYQTQIDTLNTQLHTALATRRILTPVEQQDIFDKLASYRALNQSLGSVIENSHYDTDVGRITTSIGEHQQKIAKLEEELKETSQTADTAEARARAVDRREQKVSYHQLYMMDRPLRQLSIPVLFTISIAFIMGAIFFMYKLNAVPAAISTTTAPITASGVFNWFKSGPSTTGPITTSGRGLSELFRVGAVKA